MYLRISKKNDIDLYSLFCLLKQEKFNISGIVEKLFSNYADGKDLDISSIKECLKKDILVGPEDKEIITIIINTDKNENIRRLFDKCGKRRKTAFAKALLRAAFGALTLKFFFSSENTEIFKEKSDNVNEKKKDNITKKDEKISTHNDKKSVNIIKEDIHKEKHEHHNKNKGNQPSKASWNDNRREKTSNNNPKDKERVKSNSADSNIKKEKPINKPDVNREKINIPLIPEEEYFEKAPKEDKISGFLASMANWES